MNMERDIFAEQPYGKAALKKIAPQDENFRLYFAGWLGNNPAKWDTMKVTGAVFRHAKSGKDKGKLSIRVKGTDVTVYVSQSEMAEYA